MRDRPPSRGRAMLLWGGWGLCAVLAFGVLLQPVGTAAQVALCATALAGMLALWLLFPRRGLARMAFLALGTLVVIRYVYWRVTDTLPNLDDPVGFGLGLVLLGAELYCVLILTVSLIINVEPLARAPAPVRDEADLPAVDILVPSYNEGPEILSVTLAAARNLDYPEGRATVWLLDDGGTDQKCADPDPGKAAAARARRASLRALCAGLGVRYLTRARNEHAKAGNLNAGLAQSSAEIVLVLDADHAPFRPLLRETVGLFAADPKLFLVQTPHVFLNPDPIERNLRTFATMPSENEMFYGVTQAGLDKWNGSFFCGSAALLRRAALDEVGGFSGITITEDCETAFELHAKGWTSAYVDTPLIAGLQPETFADFIGQRARWCQGMFQIMLLKNPLTKPGLAPIQRLGYLSSMAFWFFPLPRLIFMLAPLLHIFLDVKIFVSSIDEALAFTATYVVANMMIQNYLYGHVRWPWISELYEYVQGVHLVRSIASVLVSPRKPSFNVTSKGGGLDHDHLSPLAWPFFAIFGALAAGCATAAWRYLYEPGVTGLMLVVGLWCLFNLVIAGAALGVVAERRQSERCPSLAIDRDGRVELGGESFAVAIVRVAADGCTLRRRGRGAWPESVSDGLLFVTPVPGAPTGVPIRFRMPPGPDGDARSVAFTDLDAAAYRTLADLMYGDAAPLRAFLAGRRSHRDLLTGSLQFLSWGVSQPVRAVAYALRGAPSASPPVASDAARAVPSLRTTAPQVLARNVLAPSLPARNVPEMRVAAPGATVTAIMAGWMPDAVPARPLDRPLAQPLAQPIAQSLVHPAEAAGMVEAPVAPAPETAPASETAPAPETAAPASAPARDPAPGALTGPVWGAAVAELERVEGETSADGSDPTLDAARWLAAILGLAEDEIVAPAPLPVAQAPVAAVARAPEPPVADRAAAASPPTIRQAA